MNNLFTKIVSLANLEIWQIVVVSILIFLVSMFLIRVAFINKKTFGMIFVGVLIFLGFGVFFAFARFDKDNLSAQILKYLLFISAYVISPIIIFQMIKKDILKNFESTMQIIFSHNKNKIEITSSKTKEIIVEAIFEMSAKKIGALITIEKYTSLEQFSERAIILNADVSKELLTNIFIPNTPLHDGAVIIKNDKIICAGAYFNLTKNGAYEKSTGSRHRAAIGISEISDALTIIASEETGDVSITYGSVLLPMPDRNSLLNYLSSFAN